MSSLRSLVKEVRPKRTRGRPTKYFDGSSEARGLVSPESRQILDKLAAAFGGDQGIALDQALKRVNQKGDDAVQRLKERRQNEEINQSLLEAAQRAKAYSHALEADRARLQILLRKASFYAGRRVERMNSSQLENLQKEVERMSMDLGDIDQALGIVKAWAQFASPAAKRQTSASGRPPPPAKSTGGGT